TDSERKITYDPINRPEVSNLLMLTSLSTGRKPEEIAEEIGDAGSGQLKKVLTESINEYLRPLRTRRKELEKNLDYVREVLLSGIAAAREEAVKTLEEVREVMNMKI
ncbi:MAG: tryptophan--tRNA ligase, partial [Clostridiaceae bacterium]|nr:tryptophan--tRNA ligase [Clostridiaceae bacterium]